VQGRLPGAFFSPESVLHRDYTAYLTSVDGVDFWQLRSRVVRRAIS
jgi:hypothetical protein